MMKEIAEYAKKFRRRSCTSDLKKYLEIVVGLEPTIFHVLNHFKKQ